MNWVPPWNYSSFGDSFKDADMFVVSVPKSGRTWLRMFMGAYAKIWAEENKRPEPVIKFTHDLWDHQTKSAFYEKVRGKRLIPRPHRYQKKMVLLLRDPRDLLVSLYFHLSKRTGEFEGTPSELVRDPMFGVEQLVFVWNHWLREWGDQPHFHIIRYEEARKDSAASFRSLLEFLELTPVNTASLEKSIELSSFQNMKKMETSGDLKTAEALGLDREALTPGQVQDPNSFKVRSGKVGGYTEHFSPEDLAFIDEALRSLDPRSGYAKS